MDKKLSAEIKDKSGGYDDEKACLQAFDALTTGLTMFATRSNEENSIKMSFDYKFWRQ